MNISEAMVKQVILEVLQQMQSNGKNHRSPGRTGSAALVQRTGDGEAWNGS